MLVMGMLLGVEGDEAKARANEIGGVEGQARKDGSQGCETGHKIGGVFMALVTPRDRPTCSACQIESPGPIDCAGRTWL
jgi:hypothetical protein